MFIAKRYINISPSQYLLICLYLLDFHIQCKFENVFVSYYWYPIEIRYSRKAQI